MQGYIKLHRALLDNPIFNCEPYTRGQAWIALLLLTNHKDGYIQIKNGELIKINRGECGYSELALADIFKWSRGKVKRFLKLLENEKMIQQKNSSNRIIIKVLNYENYQNGTVNDTVNSTVNGIVNEHLTIHQTNINNNDKNDNNEKNDNNIFISEKTKKIDPCFNELNQYFLNEYKKVFSKKAFLSYQSRNKLTELASEYSDIRELIPQAIEKLKNIEFKDIDFKPSASWLLKGDNFERVLNGEFDKKTEQKTWQELLMEKAKERELNNECT